jgi:hypothetical protein
MGLELEYTEVSHYVLVGLVDLESLEVCLTSLFEMFVGSVEDSVNVPACEVGHVLKECLFNQVEGFGFLLHSVEDQSLE